MAYRFFLVQFSPSCFEVCRELKTVPVFIVVPVFIKHVKHQVDKGAPCIFSAIDLGILVLSSETLANFSVLLSLIILGVNREG